MLCPGISQNTELHHLTLYKGQVWEEKPYPELCNRNALNILYTYSANWDSYKYPLEQNGELYVPPLSQNGLSLEMSQIPWDSEILQSFAQLTDITSISFHYYYFSQTRDSMDGVAWQLDIGSYYCVNLYGNHEKCLHPSKHYPWYIWTKEGFKTQSKKHLI